MKNLKPSETLRLQIVHKEAKLLEEELMLKEHFNVIYDSLKPINLIKNTLSEAITSPDIRHNLFNAAIGFGTGYIAKKLFINRPDGFIKTIEGNIVQLLVASKVADNADTIRSVMQTLFLKLTNWNKDKHEITNPE
jgi:hypothetical protein